MTGSEESDGGVPLAAIGQRVGARALDWVIIFMLWMAIMGPVIEREDDDTISVPLWARITSLVLLVLYEVAPIVWRGQTPGKMVVGIKTLMLAEPRTPPLINALLRVLPVVAIVIVAGQFFAVVLVFLYFSAGFAKDRRGLLDRLAGTVVVSLRPTT